MNGSQQKSNDMQENTSTARSDGCSYVNESGLRCFRKCSNASFCKKHLPLVEAYNADCPICLEKCETDYFLTSCYHKSHITCLKGMTKAECPMCREKSNFSSEILDEIERNSKKYEEEKLEEERQEILNMLNQEFATRRPPPQVEIIVALRYLYELGVPPFLIPETITMRIDPSMALPAPGFIFQNTVREIVNYIHTNSEIDRDDDIDENYEEDYDYEENIEGKIRCKILTIPIIPEQAPSPEDRQRSYVNREIFNTISFNIDDLEIPQELYDLFMNELF